LSITVKAKGMIENFNRENIMPASRRNRCAHKRALGTHNVIASVSVSIAGLFASLALVRDFA
jgi:hypothetical protein